MDTENNILLAEFMNLDKINADITLYTIKNIAYPVNKLLYHSDWNWLMEVVNKIEDFRFSDSPNSMRYDVKIKHHGCYINDWEIEGKNFIKHGGYHSKLEATYYACIDFVKWHNKNN